MAIYRTNLDTKNWLKLGLVHQFIDGLRGCIGLDPIPGNEKNQDDTTSAKVIEARRLYDLRTVGRMPRYAPRG